MLTIRRAVGVFLVATFCLFSLAGHAQPSPNSLPVAVEDHFTTTVDSVLTINTADILANDTDADGEALSLLIFDDSTNGMAAWDVVYETLTFTPDPGFIGDAYFTYGMTDGNHEGYAGFGWGLVTISVQSSGTPTATATPLPYNVPPVAVNDQFTTVSTIEIPVASFLSNDIDANGDVLSILLVDDSINGMAYLDSSAGIITFVPDPGFTGEATFTYTVTDGHHIGYEGLSWGYVSITVGDGSTNSPPQAVDDLLEARTDTRLVISFDSLLANDTDPDEGAELTITAASQSLNGYVELAEANRIVLFTPASGFTGSTSFTYTVSDGFDSTTATVNIDVSPDAEVNVEPIAVDDVLYTSMDTPIVIPSSAILANDSDANDDPLSILLIDDTLNGDISWNQQEQTINFIPAAGFVGSGQFTYALTDGNHFNYSGLGWGDVRIIVQDYSVVGTFTAASDVEPATAISSDIITIGGLELSNPISIEGGEYAIDGGPFTGEAGMVSNGQAIQVRLLSSSSFETETSATLLVGSLSQDFSVTTRAADVTPDDLAEFTAQTSVEPSSVNISNAIVVEGIELPIAVSISGGEYSIDGSTYTDAEGVISDGQNLTVRITSSSEFETSESATLTVGSLERTYTVTTRPGDIDPDPLAEFTSLSGIELSTVFVSQQISVSGIELPIPVSITGGEYSIDGSAFTGSPGFISNGQNIQVRVTSSPEFETQTQAALSIGSEPRNFSVTTRPDITIDFVKTGNWSIRWANINAGYCTISNNYDNYVHVLDDADVDSGSLIHQYPAATEFTMSCSRYEGGISLEASVVDVTENAFPDSVGLYGLLTWNTSYTSIVPLDIRIDASDSLDFYSQVDNYCRNRGYVGSIKSDRGSSIIRDDLYYFTRSYGFVSDPDDVFGRTPRNIKTMTVDDLLYSSVYTLSRDSSSSRLVRAALVDNTAEALEWISLPNSIAGEYAMVLCQTTHAVFDSFGLKHEISFDDPGPISKALGVHQPFINPVVGDQSNGDVRYSSSDTSIADVDPVTGEVTLLALGDVTISAVMEGGNRYAEATASYSLTVREPLPISVNEFSKTGISTLRWQTSGAFSCTITNDQSADVINISSDNLDSGVSLHTLPETTTFVLSCVGEDGSIGGSVASVVSSDAYPTNVGFWGDGEDLATSWAAIVPLNQAISAARGADGFYAEADSHCTSLGYLGAAKTLRGDFGRNETYYVRDYAGGYLYSQFQNLDRLISWIPSGRIYSNVYMNDWYHRFGTVARATIGDEVFYAEPVSGTATGDEQMVLCQTDLLMANTIGLSQNISFEQNGPVTKLVGVDGSTFSNLASGGLGNGDITYTSSDESVATVDSASSLVTLISQGTTTITAVKASDIFAEATASYELIHRDLLPVLISSFAKTSDLTLSWNISDAVSCVITNDQDGNVYSIPADDLQSGHYVHSYAPTTVFNLSCDGVLIGTNATSNASIVTQSSLPNSVGLYGFNNVDNSWAAIVRLDTPINFTSSIDFYAQVNNFCRSYGYVGGLKTFEGTFGTNSNYYASQVEWVLSDTWNRSGKVTSTIDDQVFDNVFVNAIHSSSGSLFRTTIGDNDAFSTEYLYGQSVTDGTNQMVLCQTDIPIRKIFGAVQNIAFETPGPFTGVLGIDSSFTNLAEGGSGNGAISYSSSDPSVASVDSTTGEVSFVSLGSVTITALKEADDRYGEATDNYSLTVRDPLPATIVDFVKTGASTLRWETSGADSCSISNSHNSEVFIIASENLDSSPLLHALPESTEFTLSCIGEDAAPVSATASIITEDAYATSVGFYGSASDLTNSWVAIVPLVNPISYIDRLDFNTQVDSYCSSLGYIGVVKTGLGDFATDENHYLHGGDGVIRRNGPDDVVTHITDGTVYTNVYTNRANVEDYYDTYDDGVVVRAVIGDGLPFGDMEIDSPTSGDNAMVLCQTDIRMANTMALSDEITFEDEGPVTRLIGIDGNSFTNSAISEFSSGEVTYTSSDTAVATVDVATGEVSYVGPGTVTISASKLATTPFAADTASYQINYRYAQAVTINEFVKTSNSSLRWTTSDALSCTITNDQDSDIFVIDSADIRAGPFVHDYPSETSFILNCSGHVGGNASVTASVVSVNGFNNAIGFFGYRPYWNETDDNYLSAIVMLDTPISFTSVVDFNIQANSYCSDLGYLGSAKTKIGDFGTNDRFNMINSRYITGNLGGVTITSDDLVVENVYINQSHWDYVSYVEQVEIENHEFDRTRLLWSSGVTSGEGQKVLCQTDLSINNVIPLRQDISFETASPIEAVIGINSTLSNLAIGGYGFGELTYTSSDTNVATVDPITGQVTIVGEGYVIISAVKAGDIYEEARASYVINVRQPIPILINEFVETSSSTLRWSTSGAVDCQISNDQNSDVITIVSNDFADGNYLHALSDTAQFTLNCDGEDGTSVVALATPTAAPYSLSVGYWGNLTNLSNSWVAIVPLDTPITFTDNVDFNNQVDSYCSSLGFYGAAKTLVGDFSTDANHYISSDMRVFGYNGDHFESALVTAGEATFSNIYINDRHYSGTYSSGDVARLSLGGETPTLERDVADTTSGLDQMVFCQTDIQTSNSYGLHQEISFDDPGPVTKLVGVDSSFINSVSEGLGVGDAVYSSSDVSVATVDAGTGEVTLVSPGTATISATKTSDTMYIEAQASYDVIYRAPQPVSIVTFEKSGAASLSWNIIDAQSCVISNDQDASTYIIPTDDFSNGHVVHSYVETTVFTLACNGVLVGSSGSAIATANMNTVFAESRGFYGLSNYYEDENYSFAAIVNLNSPISFSSSLDFNNQVDSYCQSLGYLGAVKTFAGDFSTSDKVYLQRFSTILSSSYDTYTSTPGDEFISNVYVNSANSSARVYRASFGGNSYVNAQLIAGPDVTSGPDQRVMCQTDINISKVW